MPHFTVGRRIDSPSQRCSCSFEAWVFLPVARSHREREEERPRPAPAPEPQDGPMGEPSAAKPLPVPNE
jgi:hypothetical protein